MNRCIMFGLSLIVAGLVPVSARAATTKIEKTFGNWRVECVETTKDKKCGLVFALVNKKAKQLVFGWSIIPAKDGAGNKTVIRTLTGTDLAAGVTVDFPGAEPIKIPYKTCGPRNCFAEVEFSDAWLKAFNSQQSLTVNYNAANGKAVKHQVDLKNFKEAYEFYTSQAKPAQ